MNDCIILKMMKSTLSSDIKKTGLGAAATTTSDMKGLGGDSSP
jgi:hypothetical protein